MPEQQINGVNESDSQTKSEAVPVQLPNPSLPAPPVSNEVSQDPSLSYLQPKTDTNTVAPQDTSPESSYTPLNSSLEDLSAEESQYSLDKVESSVSWSAVEFVAHDKATNWYLGLLVMALIFATIIYLLTRDKISVAVVIVAAVIFGIYASRQPKKLDYTLNRSGITIGPKTYRYDDFKSFSVIREPTYLSLNFMPLKRFAPLLTILFSPQDEEKVMNILTTRLPYEEPRRDAVDSLMRRIRF